MHCLWMEEMQGEMGVLWSRLLCGFYGFIMQDKNNKHLKFLYLLLLDCLYPYSASLYFLQPLSKIVQLEDDKLS